MEVKREIINYMNFLKDKYPILALTGPRQSGKTTLLRELFPDYRYISLENPDLRKFAENDPNKFLEEYDSFCIIDEAQRVPHLFSYLQTIVDEKKIMGQYILSGSQNFLLLKNITQSLAGRVALFKLFPFDFNEMKAGNFLSKNYIEAMINGFYPAIYDRNIPSTTFYKNYIETYVERDIAELVNIRDMRTFRTFLSLCAARAGSLINLSSLANDCNITQPTAKSWLSLLESSYIIYLLHPYHKNFDKRVIKSSKLYFYDTGLLCHLLKIKDEKQIKFNTYKGHLFENMIVMELVKQNHHQNLMKEFWFWRNSDGREIDLLTHEDDFLDVFEIKSTSTITPNLFKELEYFEKLAKDEIGTKTLIYSGLQTQNRTFAKVLSWYDIK
ncbi:ATP-binding protein [Flavobacterium sp.]|uniref:ATP-binding protein n=1 Tax=Flavobacterium sp. TaxID=239 RepID=UPI003752BB08